MSFNEFPFYCRDRQVILLTILAAVAIASASGCGRRDGPVLGKVKGVVTINGEQAAGLGVAFSQDGARSSFGYTDESGEYQLKYVKDARGAVVGDHRVRIDYVQQEGDSRHLPEKYNRNTELTAKVERGSNVINFNLESE